MCPRSIAGVPSSQALPGYLIAVPPSVCVPDVIGALAVWIQNQKKEGLSQLSSCFQMRMMRVSLPRVFFFFLKKKSAALLSCGRWEVSKTLGLVSKKSYHHLGLSPMRPNELWTYPDDGAARAQDSVCSRQKMG